MKINEDTEELCGHNLKYCGNEKIVNLCYCTKLQKWGILENSGKLYRWFTPGVRM